MERDRRVETHYSAWGPVISKRTPTTDAVQFGGVCKRCNCGWMSRLESETSALLRAILALERGDAPTLSTAEAGLLALWACKTALMVNVQANFRRIVPEEHFRYLFEKRQIVPGVCVDIGRTPVVQQFHIMGLDSIQSQTQSVCIRPEDERRFEGRTDGVEYRILLWIGWLVFRVVYVSWPDYKLLLDVQDPARMRRLHPKEGENEVRVDGEPITLSIRGPDREGPVPELAALCHQTPMVPREGPDDIMHYVERTVSIRAGRIDGPPSRGAD